MVPVKVRVGSFALGGQIENNPRHILASNHMGPRKTALAALAAWIALVVALVVACDKAFPAWVASAVAFDKAFPALVPSAVAFDKASPLAASVVAFLKAFLAFAASQP